jgi:hypothetical protein
MLRDSKLTPAERVEMYCQSQCQTKPCAKDCLLLGTGKPLTKIGRFCMDCMTRKGMMTGYCQSFNCHLRGYAPQKSKRRLRSEFLKRMEA